MNELEWVIYDDFFGNDYKSVENRWKLIISPVMKDIKAYYIYRQIHELHELKCTHRGIFNRSALK
jgi:hypothetical protein